jgi:MFS family permease
MRGCCLDSQLFNLARDGAMESLIADKKQATVLAPFTTSWFLLGWAVGGLIFGALGDRFGRAKILTVTILIYSLSPVSMRSRRASRASTSTDLSLGSAWGRSVRPRGGPSGRYGAGQGPRTRARPAAITLGVGQHLSRPHRYGYRRSGCAGPLPFDLPPWQALFVIGAAPALLSVFVLAKLKEPEKWVRARAAVSALDQGQAPARRLIAFPPRPMSTPHLLRRGARFLARLVQKVKPFTLHGGSNS